ncbi:MAG: SpoIID/LytB domain-containing protein, partial [Calditrichaeota bacterium]|nr:SpoIID/LytB domain-containing protein [Calditrichota bacterium]
AQQFDPEARIDTFGGNIYLNERKINNNTKYVIISGDYSSEIEARKDFKRFKPEFNPTVIKDTVKEPRGTLEFFDAEYETSGEAKDFFKVVPADVSTKTKLYSIRSFDAVLQREHFEDRVYNASLEFRFGNDGKLMVISEIPLESYLKRVVFSEIGTDLPIEFTKSLAIVSRSEVMARVAHKHPGDPYDMCDWGHCLRYYGTEFEDENIDSAVEATRGEVIFTDETICDAYFNLICGGHTEDATGVWELDEEPQFHGKYDWKKVPEGFNSLQNEEIVRKWILSRPDAWCNLRVADVPKSLEKYKKYFRWEVDYSRQELEKLIYKNTGEDIGILFDIVPLRRGSSGRLKEIELIGSLKNYRIKGELNIREVLAQEYLESSCFIVEKELDQIGTPISFTLVGAGQGHGVGMCKTGGAMMALEGYKSGEILQHYFEDCHIRSIHEKKSKK